RPPPRPLARLHAPADDACRGVQGRHRLRRPRPPPRRHRLAAPGEAGRLRPPRRARRDALALPLSPRYHAPRRHRRRDSMGSAMSLFDQLTPPEVAGPETAEDDPRLGRWLAAQRRLSEATRV